MSNPSTNVTGDRPGLLGRAIRAGIATRASIASLMAFAAHVALATLVATLVSTLVPNVAPALDAPRELNFDVFLDERPIGYHRFALVPTADGLEVAIRAEFELRILRIKALDYDHENRERWRAGCLESIESRTEQNGKPYRVAGRVGPDGFAIESEEGRVRLTGCVGSFSYWDRRALLGRRQLLNSQTGEYVDVETRSLGTGTLEIGGRPIAVDRYEIRGEDLEIRLAYAREGGEWIALDSPLFVGQTLRYRRRAADLPGRPSAPTAEPLP